MLKVQTNFIFELAAVRWSEEVMLVIFKFAQVCALKFVQRSNWATRVFSTVKSYPSVTTSSENKTGQSVNCDRLLGSSSNDGGEENVKKANRFRLDKTTVRFFVHFFAVSVRLSFTFP